MKRASLRRITALMKCIIHHSTYQDTADVTMFTWMPMFNLHASLEAQKDAFKLEEVVLAMEIED